MRKIFIFAAFFLAAVFIVLSFSELESIAVILERSQTHLLLLAVGVQLLWLLNDGLEYRRLYQAVGLPETLPRLALLAAGSNFINVIAPSGGMGGVGLFLENAARRGYPRGHAVAVSALYYFLDYWAFLGVLSLGIIVLIRRNDLNGGEIAASTIMVILVAVLGVLLLIGSRSAHQLGRALGWLAQLGNHILWPLFKREYFNETRAHLFAAEITEGLSILHSSPRRLLRPLFHAVANKALLMSVMTLIFLNFGIPFSAGTLVAGFAMAHLFLIVSPTPSGVGIVESILPVTLNSLRVPWEEAVVVALSYRAITFWMPFGLGAAALRLLHSNLIGERT